MCRVFVLSLAFLVCYNVLWAQLKTSYTVRDKHYSFPDDFIKIYNQQLKQEFPDSVQIPNRYLVNRINAKRQTILVSQLKKGLYIKDDSLEHFVATVLQNLNESNPFLSARHRKILIVRNAQVNAFCFGRGVFIVNIGLLGRLENEDQLAFVIAHEMAHDELGHIRERILREANTNLSKKASEQVKKILTGTIDVEEIEELRNLIYGITKHSRENELSADSMALILTHNAGYDRVESILTLSMLENSLKPKRPIDVDLFLPFDATQYPFQIDWLNGRLSIYSKERSVGFIGLKDSIDTHPEFEMRIEKLNSQTNILKHEANYQDSDFVNNCVEVAEFETVETAYQQKNYDWSMFYAMQLLNRYPKNGYLISRIGRMLITLSEAKDEGEFNIYVSRYTSYYSDELRWVNNFLFNITAKEMKELAFYFLSNSQHFDEKNKNHYYLLVKICELTARYDVKKITEQNYKKMFGKNIGSHEYY